MGMEQVRVAVFSTLINDDGLDQLVAGRVYANSIAEYDEDELVYPRVHIRVIGGPSLSWGGTMVRQNVQVTAYSKKDYDEAARIMDAVHTALAAVRVEVDGKACVFLPAQVPQETFDPDNTVYYSVSQWRVPNVS